LLVVASQCRVDKLISQQPDVCESCVLYSPPLHKNDTEPPTHGKQAAIYHHI